MKNTIKLSSAILLILSLSACGGSSDSAIAPSTDTSKTYDMWDYLTSGTASYTVYYDTIVEENGTVESTAINALGRDVTETSTSVVQYRTTGTNTSRHQYLKNDNNISFSVVDYNSTMNRYLDVNDTIFDINYTSNGYNMNVSSKVTNYYDTFSLRVNYGSFSNVMEVTDTITIDGNSTYYSESKSYIAKGVGSIGSIDRDCYVPNDDNTSYYMIDSETSCSLLERVTYELRH